MTATPRAPLIEPGTVLHDRYHVQDELGRGGYSVVYAARDERVQQDIAVKVLVPPPVSLQQARERMRREVHVVRELNHPGVVAVYDCIDDGPWTFIAMERIDGVDLARRVKRDGPLPVDLAVDCGTLVADALEAAHTRGILHRDVKPQNILIDSSGAARLTDFGSARFDGFTITRTGGLLGTVQYLAPEVVLGRRADARADVYALGVTLYYALTGRLPKGASNHAPPPPSPDGFHPAEVRAEVPQWLDTVIARATGEYPETRFATAAAFAAALARRDAGRWATRSLSRCVLCGHANAFGVGVCPACGGLSHDAADVLVFVRPANGAREQRAIRDRVRETLGDTGRETDVGLVADGQRALVAVPSATSQAAIRQLAHRGIPARTRRLKWALTPAPGRLYGFLGLNLAAGWAAGLLTAPIFLWMTPLVVSMLFLAAQQHLLRPVLRPPRRRRTLSPAAERRLVECFRDLPPGTARDILAAMVQNGEKIVRRVRGDAAPSVTKEDIEELLTTAGAVACDLGALDDGLAQLERALDGESDPDSWVAGFERAERLRDRLTQQLLVALAGIQRLRSRRDGTRFSELSRAIAADAELYAGARDEVERLVAWAA